MLVDLGAVAVLLSVASLLGLFFVETWAHAALLVIVALISFGLFMLCMGRSQRAKHGARKNTQLQSPAPAIIERNRNDS